MAHTLTVQQLVDILLQKPERITAGILDRRTPAMRLRDIFMVRTKTEDMGFQPGRVEFLKRKLLLEFHRTGPVHQPHPRAMKNALLELRALGYTNLQLRWMSYETANAVIGYFEPPSGPGHARVRSQTSLRSDDGFLGYIACTKKSSDFPKTHKGLSDYIRSWQNPDNNRDTVFLPGDDAPLNDWLACHFTERQAIRPGLLIPGTAMPARTP